MPETLRLEWFGDVGNGVNVKPAFDNMFRRAMKAGGEYIILIPRTSLTLNSMVVFPQGLKSCVLIPTEASSSTDTQRPEFVKKGGFSDQYMLYFSYSTNLLLNLLDFRGNEDIWASVSQATPVYMWGKEGVYFGSCSDMTVDACNFTKLGDSAVRMTTHGRDKNPTGSKNGLIQNCRFENIYQVTTTSSGDTQKGGTQNWTVQDNTFINVGGGLKYASRQPCGGGRLLRNTINGSHDKGIDLSGVYDVDIIGNNISNTVSAGISYYTNSRGIPYQCGNFQIQDNVFDNCGTLYIGNKPYQLEDGTSKQFTFNDLWIVNNTFRKMKKLDGGYVITTSGPFEDMYIFKNTLEESPGFQLIRQVTSDGVVVGGNKSR